MKPGTYYGQCAEFCGLQHGMMKFRIVALDATAWQTWVLHHKEPAASSDRLAGAQGMDLFLTARMARVGNASRVTRSGDETGVNASART